MNYVFTVTILLDASSNICVTHMHLLYKDENTYIIQNYQFIYVQGYTKIWNT
jgi:hypothetical protein